MIKLFEEFVEERKMTVRNKLTDIISKEDFVNLMYQEGIDIGDEDNDYNYRYSDELNEYQKKCYKLLSTAYGVKNANELFITFYNMDIAEEFSEEESREVYKNFYDFTCNLNTKWAENESVLGCGADGIVFDLGDSVAKFFYRKIDQKTMLFLKNCRLKRYKTLPHIFKLKDSWYVMEHLKITDEANFYAEQFLNGIFDDGTYDDFSKDFSEWYETFLKEAEDCGFDEIIEDGFKNEISEKLDCHIGNFGQRDNGDIVFFDPYSHIHYKGYTIAKRRRQYKENLKNKIKY